jgi:hypothetical protein
VFTKPLLAAIDAAKIVGIRAGDTSHRFVGVWAVVVDRRVFARSWEGRPDGWYYTLLEERKGRLQVGERQVRIAARRARGDRLMKAIEAAYAEKFNTPGSLKYVRGFKSPSRRARTIELIPAGH